MPVCGGDQSTRTTSVYRYVHVHKRRSENGVPLPATIELVNVERRFVGTKIKLIRKKGPKHLTRRYGKHGSRLS